MIPLLYLFNNWGLLALRVVVGVILMRHGIPKLKNLKGTGEWLASVGFRPGRFWAAVVAVVETFGGAALILGFYVQAAAFVAVGQFFVILAWRIIRRDTMAQGIELDMLLFAALLVLLTAGAGNFSVDSFWGLGVY